MEKLFLLDAYALIYRAYFAFIRSPRINSKGMNTSTILGFVNTLEYILKKENPTHIGVAFDPAGPTFRHTMFEAYKAQREKTPEDITKSVPIIKEIIKAYNIPILEVPGFEADDVIGTLATKASKRGITTYMVTPDKDYGQLVRENVYMLKPHSGEKEFELMGIEEIKAKFHIDNTQQVIDILGLMGDKADNIPGCPGVGETTAPKLITEFGSIENLLENTDKLKGALKQKVENNKEQIKFSKLLSKMDRRTGKVLEEEPTIVNPENPLMVVENGDIEFRNVNFKYKETAEKNALSNINLKIKSGQFVGILGSTGSGKTSLVNLISRLYDVTDGEILVGDHNVKEYDLKTLRDNVSVVLQKNVLFSGTIESNLKWGNINATQEQMTRAAEIAQCLDNILAKPGGFQAEVEQGGANFSGGQKQRLCIARAILKEPKIMILDDSTSAVDTRTDKLIRKGLKEDLPHMTKIVIAQRISSVEDADQIIIMDNGQINAVGTHDELLKSNKIYQEVYYSQNRVGGKK